MGRPMSTFFVTEYQDTKSDGGRDALGLLPIWAGVARRCGTCLARFEGPLQVAGPDAFEISELPDAAGGAVYTTGEFETQLISGQVGAAPGLFANSRVRQMCGFGPLAGDSG